MTSKVVLVIVINSHIQDCNTSKYMTGAITSWQQQYLFTSIFDQNLESSKLKSVVFFFIIILITSLKSACFRNSYLAFLLGFSTCWLAK